MKHLFNLKKRDAAGEFVALAGDPEQFVGRRVKHITTEHTGILTAIVDISKEHVLVLWDGPTTHSYSCNMLTLLFADDG